METIEGRYRIQEELGRGGMGIVYHAFDAVTGREVAVKCLAEALCDHPAARLSFIEEFRRMSGIRHPNFPAAHDLGGLDGRPYFTMDLVRGRPLSEVGALDPPAVLDLLARLLRALSFLHARGYVHRDLKPGNLHRTSDGGLQLLDLGLCTPIGAVSDGKLRGTPAYVAPEVIRGGVISERTDLYSVGVLCYELLTGRRPFEGDVADLVRAHLRARPAPPSRLRPDLPAELDPIVMRLLEKRPEDRYADAAEVAADLSALVGRPVSLEGAAQQKGYLATGELVGRGGPWSRIRAALDALGAGRGGAVFVTAAAGIGKSRLMKEARLEAQLAGFRVVVAAARGAVGEPLALIADLVGPTALDGPAADLERLGPALAAQVPPLRDRLGGVAPAPADDDAVSEWLEVVARRRPLVLIAEDLHWADDRSVRALNEVIRRTGDAPILVLGTFRSDEVERPHPVYQTLDEGAAAHVPLAPFGPDETRALLEAMLPGTEIPSTFTAGVHRITAGNPFFVDELLRDLMDAGRIAREEGRFALPAHLDEAAAPPCLEHVLRRRLDRLPPGARHLVEAAAVLGEAVEIGELQAVAGLADVDLLEALEVLERRHFVERTSAGTVRLRHAHLRATVLATLAPEAARALHRRAGEALERTDGRHGERIPRLARHFAGAGDAERGVRYSLEAAELALAVHDEPAAFAHFKQAAALLEGQPARDDDLLGIYERVAEITSAVWIDAPTCLEWFRRAVAHHRARGAADRVFDLSLASMITHTIAGRYAEAHRILEALEASGAAADELRRAVLYGVGVCLLDWYEGAHRDCLRHAEEAIAFFESRLGDDAPDAAYHPYSWALFWREKARAYLGDPIDRSNIEKVRRMAEAGRSDPVIVWHTMTAVGARACFTGRMDDLFEWKRWAEESSRRLGKIHWFECWISHSFVYGMLGASRLGPLGEHVSRMFSSPDPYQRRLGDLFTGRLALARGRYDEAAAALERFLEAEERDGRDNSYPEGLIHLAHCRLAQGRLEDAEALAEAGLRVAAEGRLANPLHELQQRRVLAELALLRGALDEAEDHLDRCLVLAERGDNPIQRGAVRLQAARVVHARGRPVDAARGLDAARHAFRSIDNRALLQSVEITARRLTDGGGGPRVAAPSTAPAVALESPTVRSCPELTLVTLIGPPADPEKTSAPDARTEPGLVEETLIA